MNFLTAKVWFRFVFNSSGHLPTPAAEPRSRPGSSSGPRSWLAHGSCPCISGRSICPAAHVLPPNRKCPLLETTGVGLYFLQGKERSPQKERERKAPKGQGTNRHHQGQSLAVPSTDFTPSSSCYIFPNKNLLYWALFNSEKISLIIKTE